MGYILKNTSGLVNTKITDTGRLKMSQGSFSIKYFQIGDSEVSYNTVPTSYNFSNSLVLSPANNAQNSSGVPQSNKQQIKYPYYVNGSDGNTYGLPYSEAVAQPIFNSASMRGFFTANVTAATPSWSALTNDTYALSSNWVVKMSGLTGGTQFSIIYSANNSTNYYTPQPGDIITIYFDATGLNDQSCYNIPTPTSTPTPTPTPTGPITTCGPTPTPTPTPTTTCPNPTPPPACSVLETGKTCTMSFTPCFPILTYKVVSVCNTTITVDRNTPNYSMFTGSCYSRIIVYPSNFNIIYDTITPYGHWNQDIIDFQTTCDIDSFDVKVWNMNIAWSENPAGVSSSVYKGYQTYSSINYLGTKEYLGYTNNSGQTFMNGSTFVTGVTDTFYYNSFDEKVYVEPKDQKAVAIVHYTNNAIDNVYGEKFALEPYDSTNTSNTMGQARNFKVHLPWLMWHKSSNCCSGVTFYVDPTGFDDYDLFTVNYMQSSKNTDMNSPGLRYYHLWDDNASSDGYPNRVGKVFPDQQLIVFDDDEIIAAMSYKSNRNWTLPAPKLGLITPNTCGTSGSATGLLTGSNQTLYVTYLFNNTSAFTNSLHCNYYSNVSGPNLTCTSGSSQNVSVRFGSEFNCMTHPLLSGACIDSCTTTQGFYANKFQILCQLVDTGSKPQSNGWKIIDYTNNLSGTSVNGCITQSGLTGNTFIIDAATYNAASTYNLNTYITIPTASSTGTTLNFGDEYYFYGSIETDIQATIYEMNYKINLGQSQFQSTSNPTWTKGTKSYVTEIGLFDGDKNLIAVSKLQSPILRQGIQQFVVKFDF